MSLFKNNKKKDTIDPYWDGNPEDIQGAYLHLLNVTLHNCFQTKDIVQENCIYLPEWQIHITPEIQQLTKQSAVLGFYIHQPNWGPLLYECCASAGADAKTALAMSAASFLFGFIFLRNFQKIFQKDLSLLFLVAWHTPRTVPRAHPYRTYCEQAASNHYIVSSPSFYFMVQI